MPSGSSRLRPQGALPHSGHRRLGGLAFECCGAGGYRPHPDSPEGDPSSRTKGKCEGIGTEGGKAAMTFSDMLDVHFHMTFSGLELRLRSFTNKGEEKSQAEEQSRSVNSE